MKRVAAGAHLRLLGFLSLQNAQTIEPTTAWAAIYSFSASTRYLFLVDWAAPYGRTVAWCIPS